MEEFQAISPLNVFVRILRQFAGTYKICMHSGFISSQFGIESKIHLDVIGGVDTLNLVSPNKSDLDDFALKLKDILMCYGFLRKCEKFPELDFYSFTMEISNVVQTYKIRVAESLDPISTKGNLCYVLGKTPTEDVLTLHNNIEYYKEKTKYSAYESELLYCLSDLTHEVFRPICPLSDFELPGATMTPDEYSDAVVITRVFAANAIEQGNTLNPHISGQELKFLHQVHEDKVEFGVKCECGFELSTFRLFRVTMFSRSSPEMFEM